MLMNKRRRHDYLNKRECDSKHFVAIQADRFDSSVYLHFAFANFLNVSVSYYTF